MAKTYYRSEKGSYYQKDRLILFSVYFFLALICFVVYQLSKSPLNDLFKINSFSKYIYGTFIIFNLLILIILISQIIKQKSLANYYRSKKIKKNISDLLIAEGLFQKKADVIKIPSVKVALADLTDGKLKITIQGLLGVKINSLDLKQIEDSVNFEKKNLKDFVVFESFQNKNNSDYNYILEKESNKKIIAKSINDLIDSDDYKIVLQKSVVWDMNKNPHAIITGKTGSGKSTLLFSLIAQFFYKKIDLYIIDPKNEFSRLDYNKIYSSKDEILNKMNDFIKLLEDREEEVKSGITDKLSVNAYDLYLKPCVILIDELSAFVAQLDSNKEKKDFENNLTVLVQKGRSSGIFLICSMQNANSETIKVAIRNQFALRILLGNSSAEDVKFMFGSNSETVTNKVDKFTGFYYLDGLTEQPKRFFVSDLHSYQLNTVSYFKKLAEGRNYDKL